MLVEKILKVGKENAVGLITLASFYKCSKVDIIQQVYMEQQNGAYICISTSGKPGFYLANSRTEWEAYKRNRGA